MTHCVWAEAHWMAHPVAARGVLGHARQRGECALGGMRRATKAGHAARKARAQMARYALSVCAEARTRLTAAKVATANSEKWPHILRQPPSSSGPLHQP